MLSLSEIRGLTPVGELASVGKYSLGAVPPKRRTRLRVVPLELKS